jgi:predicted RNA-binding Zn-ribbon protein involved in translation (DUF1610 family)
MKSATVEICYNGGDYWFRCPDCGSLNINGEKTATKCPDCGAEFTVPEIQLCGCKDNELTESICEDGSVAV